MKLTDQQLEALGLVRDALLEIQRQAQLINDAIAIHQLQLRPLSVTGIGFAWAATEDALFAHHLAAGREAAGVALWDEPAAPSSRVTVGEIEEAIASCALLRRQAA